jgi:hypothetical protein
MTMLGAVVFGGLLAIGVWWLLVTAPDSEVDYPPSTAWTENDSTPARRLLTGTR